MDYQRNLGVGSGLTIWYKLGKSESLACSAGRGRTFPDLEVWFMSVPWFPTQCPQSHLGQGGKMATPVCFLPAFPGKCGAPLVSVPLTHSVLWLPRLRQRDVDSHMKNKYFNMNTLWQWYLSHLYRTGFNIEIDNVLVKRNNVRYFCKVKIRMFEYFFLF